MSLEGGNEQLALCFGRISLDGLATHDVLGMRIQNDVRCTAHIFGACQDAIKGLSFSKRCKTYFTATDIRTICATCGQSKLKYNSDMWTGGSKLYLAIPNRRLFYSSSGNQRSFD